MKPTTAPADLRRRQRRQRRTLGIVGGLLMLAGACVLLALTRMPLPLRLLVGLTDLIGGAVLLLAAHQAKRTGLH